jgi:predicted Zn-dependent peptidase
MEQLFREMCREDSFGIPRLGEKEEVEAITAESLFAHYEKILKESRIDLFYVGSEPAECVAELVKELFVDMERDYVNLPEQTPLRPVPGTDREHTMDVNQGKLCMGFVTPVTILDEGFVAMQVMNTVFGGGMTSKLFSHIREELSLCYAISSGYNGSKGILTVSAGIDSNMGQKVRQEVMKQLEACCNGEILPQELTAAKQAMRSGLLAVHDSPGAIENYYATAALSGLDMVPAEYLNKVEQTTLEQVQQAARETRLHSVFFLKGVSA